MTQVLAGQVVLIAITGITLVATASLVAPPIFRKHLAEAGISSQEIHNHLAEAFLSSFNYSLIFSAIASLAISSVIAWYFMQRVVRPIESVTSFAETLASGNVKARADFDRSIPEMNRLTAALEALSADLTFSRDEQARMLSDVAHELRTPIATVSAIVDGLEDGMVTPDSHAWKTIRDQLDRVVRLSHDVRDVSQNSENFQNNLTPNVDPADLVKAAYSAWNAKIESKGIYFNSLIQPEIPTIKADPQRLGQVLSNLLENALRFTPQGGKIELSTQVVGHFIEIAVKDNGQGISTGQLPHIFERLYRGDPARYSGDSGSGLGLTIARSIVENHGGTLKAYSEGADKGTTFLLTLPV